MSNLETRITLQRSRFHLIQQATDSDAEDDVSQSSRQSLNIRLEMLEMNWAKFQEEHEGLCHSLSTDLQHHEYFKTRTFERCHAFYVHAKAKLLTQRDDRDAPVIPSRSEASGAGLPSGLSRHLGVLPRITLPQFSGDYQEWKSYCDLFSSLVRDNMDLSPVEKMHYLKTSLRGEAARLVSNLSVSGDHFEIAWETLVSRYENKRLLVSTHLDRLVNMKPLKARSAQGLSAFLANITESLGALKALGCLVQYWDPLLLHLLVRLLDSESREAWEVRLGSSTSTPTFSQFEDFLIGRARAMQNLYLHHSLATPSRVQPSTSTGISRPRITAHVATPSSTGTSLTCPVCHCPHYLSNCPTFQAKSVSQRRDIVTRHRRCYNCLGRHAVNQCRISTRCHKCGRKHHTALHETSKLPATLPSASRQCKGINDNLQNAGSS